MAFSKLGLSKPVVHAVNQQNFTTPTDIQTQTIPALLAGEDVMGVAQTGGGKTAAFLLPLIEKLLQQNMRPMPGKPNAIILAPTRELAIQIAKAATDFCRGLGIYNTVIYGGAPYRSQLNDLQRGVHIVIATPGRLMDHVRRNSIRFDNAETYILDEADRMLEMGFIDDVKDVHSQLKEGHQTVMFSATMSKQIKVLSQTLLKNPTLVEVSTEGTVADTIDHRIMTINHSKKREALNYLLQKESMYKALIFTRTKRVADKLADEMRGEGMKVDSIHGDRQQRVRERILKGFKGEKIQYLIATDVAARGIDISDITHVINYDMPLEAESYVHRVGRTGRAGRKGIAISFCATDESNLLRDVERTIGEALVIDYDHPLHEEMKSTFRGKPKSGQGRSRGNGEKRGFGGRGFGGRKDFDKKPERTWSEKPERSENFERSERSERNEGRNFGGNREGGNRNHSEGRSWGGKSEGRSFNRDNNRSENRGVKREVNGNRAENFNRSERNDNRKFSNNDGNRSFGGNREGASRTEGRSFNRTGERKFGGNSEGRSFNKSEGRSFGGRSEANKSRDAGFEGRSFGNKPAGGKSFARPSGPARGGKPTAKRSFAGNTGFKGKPAGNKPFRGAASR